MIAYPAYSLGIQIVLIRVETNVFFEQAQYLVLFASCAGGV
jgi:hypothetical protein